MCLKILYKSKHNKNITIYLDGRQTRAFKENTPLVKTNRRIG